MEEKYENTLDINFVLINISQPHQASPLREALLSLLFFCILLLVRDVKKSFSFNLPLLFEIVCVIILV